MFIHLQSPRLTDLSWELRLYCFAGCLILSIIASILGAPFLFYAKYSEFAVMVSLGSIISIVGTFFLSGPMKQLKNMFDPTRLIATIIYLIMIVLTLVAGIVLRNPILAIICIVGQYAAMIWYSISFIPFARETLIGCFGKCC
jgi:hypothetical protein